MGINGNGCGKWERLRKMGTVAGTVAKNLRNKIFDYQQLLL